MNDLIKEAEWCVNHRKENDKWLPGYSVVICVALWALFIWIIT